MCLAEVFRPLREIQSICSYSDDISDHLIPATTLMKNTRITPISPTTHPPTIIQTHQHRTVITQRSLTSTKYLNNFKRCILTRRLEPFRLLPTLSRLILIKADEMYRGSMRRRLISVLLSHTVHHIDSIWPPTLGIFPKPHIHS